MKQPRKLSLVTFTDEAKAHWDQVDPSRFGKLNTFIFLGEIPNMRGHCVLLEFGFLATDKIHKGYHTDNFRELTEDEV